MSNSGGSRRSARPPKVQTLVSADTAGEDSPLLAPGTLTLNYNSDSAVYDLEARDRTCRCSCNATRVSLSVSLSAHTRVCVDLLEVAPMQHRHFYYGPGTHYSTTVSSDEEDDSELLDFPAMSYQQQQQQISGSRQLPRANWRGLVSRKSKRTVRPFLTLSCLILALVLTLCIARSRRRRPSRVVRA